eukprot:XP_006575429.2 uncharacterized protein LOC100816208 [Glycine max]
MPVEIHSWLQQPKVRKFLCFVSSIVGLICYALSSSFNKLFGKWTWWNILLYIVFCLCIIFYLVYMLANTWEPSLTSSRLKAHSAFLVLLMTSVYSFFVDKELQGKPDVYSLVSSAAFAIASLGLSTLTTLGFEVDLLYFFSGVLIVQLMKINLWLVIVGGGFSYFLIILRSTLENEYNQIQDIEIGLHRPSQGTNVSQVSSSPQAIGNAHPQADASQVTQVALSSQQGNRHRGLIRARYMSHIEELKKENGKLIDTISKHVGEYLMANVVNEDGISVPEMQADDNLVADVLPQGIINNLRETGRLMLQNECCNVYSRVRREFLKECLSKFGLQVEELNVEDIDKMEKIESWIKALNITVRILFPNERRLCDLVFSPSYAADISFGEVCKELNISLLRFANTLATENHSPFHLCHLIPKVFKTLSDLIPNFNSLFYGQLFSESLRNDAVLVGKRLGIFVELESLIHREMPKETVPDGGIHPTTHKVMDYLRDVFIDNQSFSIRTGVSSFSDQVARIIQVLDSSLEAKSKNYTDPALGHVFMINNLMLLQYEKYIYRVVIFGEDWYKSKINQNIELYQRSSLDKILDFLNLDSNELLLAESMKKKLKLFNQHFNEICKAQSEWLIFDEQLKEQMIKSIENKLLPAYGTFLGRIHDVLGKDAYDFIRYGIQNIQDLLSGLFLVIQHEGRREMSENGEEKLLAVARHIAKTLGHNNTMSDDIFQILSNFDGRFSRENLSEKGADADPRGCAALDHSLKTLDRRISLYVSYDRPIWSDAADSAAFLDAVDKLVAVVAEWNHLASDKAVAACLVRAEDMLQHAMFRLGDEFRSLMERGGESFGLTRSYWNGESTENLPFESDEDEEEEEARNGGGDKEEQIPVALPVTGFDIVIDALPSGTINDLHEIAKRMVAGGFGKECSHVYSSCRREFLEESVSRLGLQKLSIEEVHKMTWQDLEGEIEKWIKASNVALKILFPSERRLCDRVFFGFASASDFSFMEVCRGSAIQLLNFADAVAIGSRSPERLFRILDVFETLRDLIPEFEALFSDQFSVSLRNEAITIWRRLGEAIRGIFMELENLIRRDPAKMAVPGGGLHPITRYVMNYLRAACRSRQSLEQVFEDYGLKEYTKLEDRVPSSSSLSVQMDWIMELLESNLEAKSRIYKDPALRYVFLMNNGRYIVQKTKDSELGTLLGDDWIRKHAAKVRQFHVHYQRCSWTKVLGILKLDSNGSSLPPNGLAKSMKETLKLFNTVFEETCREHSSWFVFDEQLREEIRISLEKILLPAYGNFVARFESVAELGKNADKYIKYGTEEIQATLNGLFQGSSGSTGSRK